MSSVLVMGGPRWGVAAIEAMGRLGHHVALTDRNPACAGRDAASSFHEVSATDEAGLRAVLRRLDAPALVYCGNDFASLVAHRLNEAIQGRRLMDADPEVFVDKARMKAFFLEHAIPCARGGKARLRGLKESPIGYPCIVKPVAASGAIGVRWIDDGAALAAYRREYGGDVDEVLVEEVMEGTQHGVNGYVVDGQFHPAGLSDRVFAPYPACYPVHGSSPSTLPDDHVAACYAALARVADAAGLVTGPLKADVFVTTDGRVLMTEVGLRLHGDITSAIVLPHTGRHFPLPAYLGAVTGAGAATEAQLRSRWLSREACVRWEILEAPSGTFEGIDGVEAAQSSDDVIAVLTRFRPGTTLRPVRDNRDMLGYLLTRGESHGAAREAALRARAQLRVRVTP